jgi:hypothetical protein
MNMLPITQPNPIQTRDRLRSLPRSGAALQQTIQYLTRAAQGGVPTVEPYIALSELNEIKRENEKMQSAQATAGGPVTPLVQSLPEQVQQTAGIAGLQRAKAQQAQGAMMSQAMRAPQPIPEGVPQPVEAARGGLMSLPRRPKPNFRSGGIIAFQDRGVVEDPDAEETGATGEKVNPATAASARARLAQLQGQMDARLASKPPTTTTDLETELELAKKYPERFGILSKPVGEGQIDRLAEFQQRQREDLARRGRENKISLGQALMAGAEASRGQKGFGNIASILMGAGKSAAEQRKAQTKEFQALRQEDLKLYEGRMLAENKLQDLQRAKAEGDADKEAKARMDLAKIAKDYNVSLNTLLGKEYSALYEYLGRTDAANTAAAARAKAAAAGADKTKLPEQLGRAEVELTRLTPGTEAYAAKEAEVKALRRAVQTTKDVGPERAYIMRQQLLVNEDKDVRSKMADFEFSPEMQAAKLLGPDEETRVFTKKLNELRGIGRSDVDTKPFEEPAPKPAAKPAAPAPKPEPIFVGTPTPLPAKATAATLKVGTVYETARGPGRWNGSSFTPVKVQSE